MALWSCSAAITVERFSERGRDRVILCVNVAGIVRTYARVCMFVYDACPAVGDMQGAQGELLAAMILS